ncbi:glutamate--tRNA ligase [Patescibacteria group bacterium]|nr:glutamate--tRNA ligase [Patescibacteria group bacterium]MDE1946519.1 glutamate--tRNA ligase [Patescibacteria group bacterium]MDE2010920.1 glutamate--tRNA ligase [Patescibacteria group bacterium]MDE2233649.1 glutamate--tRNA ligase [Patescibacteria group bacterium]
MDSQAKIYSGTKIVTRFAPSPTGFLHVGGARTALFNYLFTKKNGGKIILRIEDTDAERNKPEYAEGIVKAFDWLGIKFNQIHKQSENFPVHRKYLEKLIANGKAFVSKEEPREEGQRSEVIRFKNDNKDIIFEDLIKGEVKFNTTELGDFVIAKSLDEPIFHFSNVIDDINSGITHIIRGEEHLSNTPRQILIWEAVSEAPRPSYAHIPLILSEQKEKISKRKHGEIVSVEYYQRNGYLPEAFVNFLASLGWNAGDDREIFNLQELTEVFSLEKVQKAGAVFNQDKLRWFNRQYLMRLNDEEFIGKASKFMPEWLRVSNTGEQLPDSRFRGNDIRGNGNNIKIMPLIRDKIHAFGEIPMLFETGGELSFVRDLPDYAKETLLWKKNPDPKTALRHLNEISKLLSAVDENKFTTDNIKSALWSYAEANGKGDVLWPVRVAFTGQEKSPDPFVCAFILGKNESLSRIHKAIENLSNQ